MLAPLVGLVSPLGNPRSATGSHPLMHCSFQVVTQSCTGGKVLNNDVFVWGREGPGPYPKTPWDSDTRFPKWTSGKTGLKTYNFLKDASYKVGAPTYFFPQISPKNT